MIVGYYIFLGSGDYHHPSSFNKKWTMTWGLDEWIRFIDELQSMEVNTMMIYLNGHKLPYRSKCYPDLVDHEHPNVKMEFLSNLFSYAKNRGIKIIAVLTTTGHAGGFSEINTESKIKLPKRESSREETLVSFPQHLRAGKLEYKAGAAQLGFGVLCHHKTLSRNYAENILLELIELYGKYFNGIALHPPESVSPCCCSCCCELFFNWSGVQLTEAPIDIARKFFISSYLEYQQNGLFRLIKQQLPSCELMMFTIPWFFEQFFDEIRSNISKEVMIIEWDYNLSEERVNSLANRLEKYVSSGYKVCFMPTAGFSFDLNQLIDTQVEAVHHQINIAESCNVDGIVHFLGPKMSDYFTQTSRQNLTDSSRAFHCGYT